MDKIGNEQMNKSFKIALFLKKRVKFGSGSAGYQAENGKEDSN